jgi:predicted acyl esterase
VSFVDRADAGRVPPAELVSKNVEAPNGAIFASEPLSAQTEFNGLFSGRLDFKVNKMDMDLYVVLYEQRADGEYVRLFDPSYEFRASYARDRAHRHLLKAGERQELTFRSERLTSRLLEKGSRLVFVIGINKRPDREINYGTGNDVSEESIADGRTPLKIRWYNDSYIEIPVHGPAGP